tara:strand:+ start:45 stop:1172 length:1128 start_codon:yes stop_codon:yes gene_type:complete
MELGFSEEQHILRSSVASMCRDYADFKSLRIIEDSERGYSEDFWSQIKQMGLTGVTIPEEYGGSNMDLLDTAVIYEEFGRSLALSPHFISSIMSSYLIAALGNVKQKQLFLPNIASGNKIMTVGWLEKSAGYNKSSIMLELKKYKNISVLNGKKHMVPYASSATEVIVFFNDGKDVGAAVVELNQDGVSYNYQENLAKTSMYEVVFENVEISNSMILSQDNFWSRWEEVAQKCQCLIAAEAAGGCERALYIGRDYSLEREAFGEKIGSFQSIAHYLADGLVDVEANKLMTYQAAWAHDQNINISKLSAMAKLQACRSFRDVSATTIQIYGGMGFTVEADPQLFFRRAKHLQNYLWDDMYLEAQLEKLFFGEIIQS